MINAQLTNSFIYDKSYNTFRPDLHYTAEGDGQTASVITGWEQFVKAPYSYTANNGTSINISLSRFSAFATQFTAEKMPDGQLYISISASKDETTYTSPEIIVTGEGTPVENIFTVGDPLYNDLANSGITATLNFTWKRANGEEMKLTPANITFKKDTQYNITIKVNPYTDLGLSLSISEDPFYMEENYDINDGVITEITK